MEFANKVALELARHGDIALTGDGGQSRAEIAAAISLLPSGGARHATGARLSGDGGQSLPK